MTGSSACNGLVMIVDDDNDVRQAIAEVLEDNEFCPMSASNGSEALEQLRRLADRPCLILLDMMMPVMDGWQFCAAREDDPELRGIPVVILSAHEDARKAAEELHVADVLRKPIQLDSLLKTIQRYCVPVDHA